MYDKDLAREILQQIHHAVEIILNRLQPIRTIDDLTDSPKGMEKLDAICMQLIVIGEGLKNFDKVTSDSILCRYPEVEWKKAKGLKDIITHHYADINAEAIYETCKNKLPQLKNTLESILKDME